MLLRTFFDYFVFAIGGLATLGAFRLIIIPPMLVRLTLILSAFICFYSILSLGADRFHPRLSKHEQRSQISHILVTLIPTVYLLTHLGSVMGNGDCHAHNLRNGLPKLWCSDARGLRHRMSNQN